MGSSNLVLSFICAASLAMAQICISQNNPEDFINAHNKVRALVRVPPMKWNESVAAYARSYLNLSLRDCSYMRSNGPYGENFLVVGRANTTAADVVAFWVRNEQSYDYDRNICVKPCSDYLQVVWSRSLQLGCARAPCKNGYAFFVLCNYYPKGNTGQRPF